MIILEIPVTNLGSGLVDNRCGLVSRSGGWVVRFGLRVDGGSFVFDVSNITVIMISSIGNGLDTTVGKGNLV
jgi:hypothetical protein